jgi:hypothetical protein
VLKINKIQKIPKKKDIMPQELRKILRCDLCGTRSSADGFQDSGIHSTTLQREKNLDLPPWFCSILCCSMKKHSLGIDSMSDLEYKHFRETMYNKYNLPPLEY